MRKHQLFEFDPKDGHDDPEDSSSKKNNPITSIGIFIGDQFQHPVQQNESTNADGMAVEDTDEENKQTKDE